MPHEGPPEPLQKVLDGVQEEGTEISRSQLHRWQRGGVIPRPRQRGLGRDNGSDSLYPPGTTRQVIRVCELLKEDRSLTRARWRLWAEGFALPDEFREPTSMSLRQDSTGFAGSKRRGQMPIYKCETRLLRGLKREISSPLQKGASTKTVESRSTPQGCGSS